MDNKDIMIISEKMKGEIDRMCVTTDLTELFSMEKYLKNNLEKLWELNHDRIISNQICFDCPNFDQNKNGGYCMFGGTCPLHE